MNLSQNNETALRFENSDIKNDKIQDMFGKITLDKVFGILDSENPTEWDPTSADELDPTSESEKNMEDATRYLSDFFQGWEIPTIISNELNAGKEVICHNMNRKNHYQGYVTIWNNKIQWVDASTTTIEAWTQPATYLRISWNHGSDAFMNKEWYLYTMDWFVYKPDGNLTYEGKILYKDEGNTMTTPEYDQWMNDNKKKYNAIKKLIDK